MEKGYINNFPPSDTEAEQAVISSMLYDSDGIDIAYEILSYDDFYNAENKVLFNAIIEMYSQNIQIDIITLKNKLESMNVLQKIGGIAYITDLFNYSATSGLVRQYAEIVKEKSIRRKLLKASKKIQELAYNNSEIIENIVSEAERALEIVSFDEQNNDFFQINSILQTSLDKLEELNKRKNKITGLETGFTDFDSKTAGLQNSDFILIAARPSMGKTAFVINIAQHVSVKKNITTAIFSLEMSKEQLVNRMLSAQSCIESQKIRTGEIENDEWAKIAEAASILSEAPIYIDDKTSISIPELRAKCRKLKKEKNLGLVVIDYLQLMTFHGRAESRQQEISAISRALKSLARELEIPIIALSQLSRAVEQRRPPRPILSDLRESGAIEQDADLVCFLYREEYYDPTAEEKKGVAEVIIAKQRNGSVGTVNLRWDAMYTRFSNLESYYTND